MKKILFLMSAVMLAMSVYAAPVDQATAFNKAKSFLANDLFAGKLMAPAAVNPVLLKAESSDVIKGQPVFYIYNTSETFLVVAGDDRAEEILMVGDRPLKDINNLAPAMQDILYQYKQEIQFLQERPNLQVDKVKRTNSSSLRASTYLMTALWDQEAPYWNLCKFTRNGTSYQCLTGCPATSASMVMYYWKYPTTQVAAMPSYTGKLQTSYYSSYTFTYPALSATTFDWDNMLDSYSNGYTTAQGNAVATLMRYVGQGESMMYGTSSAGGSGIYTTDTQNIVDMYVGFGYDASTCRVVQKSSYSTSGWASLIQNEIAEGRPMVYMAVSSSGGGHAFNVDGYDSSSNKYHVNFGWSGDGNSWYSMNSFSYSGYTFNQDQQAVIGIQPPAATTPVLTVNPTSLTFTGCTTGETYTKTFTVTGTDLRGNVSVSSNNGTFTVSPTTITAAQAAAGATVTVTYKPTSSGTQSGTITVYSSGAEDKTVSVSGTATTTPKVNVNPSTLTFNTTLGTPVVQTFTLSGTNLSANVYLTLQGEGFSIDKNVVSQANAGYGTTVTVTYNPAAVGNHTGTITCTSNGAESATVILNGTAEMVKYAPVMLPANEDYINLTKFRADWTDATPVENVTSYTLEVSAKPEAPAVELIGSVAGTDFSGSGNYYDITLPAPWGGTNVRGGLNSIIYFRNYYQGSGTAGNITYTIPAGYENATFTMRITTASTSDGAGNMAVATPQTTAVNHYFTANSSYAWVVTASSGQKITITTTDSNYSPDIALIEVYSGDATNTLTATETGDANYRLIEGITDKFYTVENLTAEGTFLYKVKTLFADGTESEWSNIEEVTLFANTPAFLRGDVDENGVVDMDDLTALINYLLDDTSTINTPGAASCSSADDTTIVDMDDLTALINYLLTNEWAN